MFSFIFERSFTYIFNSVQFLPTSQQMHDCLIEDFIGISVDYATCYRISTISTKDFAFICCFIFKISSRIVLIRRRYLAFTLSFMNRSMSMRVYVGVCLFFNFVWMDLAVLKRLDFLQRFLCMECKTWDTLLMRLIIRSKDTYGEELLSHLQGFHSSCPEQMHS